jgi:glycine cleavage system aminomethyltransferase T
MRRREAGLAFAVKMNKAITFIGRDALAANPPSASTKRLVLLSFDDPTVFPWAASRS